jgi:hypothetical protein
VGCGRSRCRVGLVWPHVQLVVVGVGLVFRRVWLFWWGRVVAVGASTGHVWPPDNALTVARDCWQQQGRLTVHCDVAGL